MFVILYQQTGGKPKCTIFTCWGWVYGVFDLELKHTVACYSFQKKAVFPTSNVFSGSYLPKKIFFSPCTVKTRAVGAPHWDDGVH